MNFFEGAYRLAISAWIAGTLGMAGYGLWRWWANPFRQFGDPFDMSPQQMQFVVPWVVAAIIGPVAAIAARRLVRWVRNGFKSN